MRLLVLTVAATLVTSWAATPAFAAGGTSYQWVGSSQDATADNHSWTDSRNWSPNGVPHDGDSVTIAEPDAAHCTAHVDAVPTIALVNFSLASTRCGSSVTGGAITVTGSFAWDGGELSTPTTIAGTGTLSGADNHLSVLSADLDVAGVLTLSGLADSGASNQGGFRMVNPHVLHVLPGGTLDSEGSNAVQFLACCVSPAKIVNDGTLHVAAGDLVVRAVEVDQHGSLTASSGGRLVSVGDPISAGAGATYSGSGRWLMENGSAATLAGTQHIGTGFHVELGGLDVDAGAQLGGTATLTGGGAFDWTGGTIEGNLTIAHGMHMDVAGAHTGNGKRVLYGQDGLSANAASAVTNHGVITFGQGAAVVTGFQARLDNASDGTLRFAPGTQWTTISCCINPSAVLNAGAVVVPSGTSSAPVLFTGVAYRATGGTTSVAAGRVLQLETAPSALSGTAIKGGGRLILAAPTAVSETIGVGSGTTLALQAHGTMDGTATIGGSGAVLWSGGALSGDVTVASGAGLRISGADLKSVANIGGGSTPSKVTVKTHTVLAAGTATHPNPVELGQSALTLASSTTVGRHVAISHGTLANTGSLTIDPGSTGSVRRDGGTSFVNRGTVHVKTGTLLIDGSYTQRAGATEIGSGAHLELVSGARTIALAGGAVEGTGTVDGGIDNTGGAVKPGGTATGTLHVHGAYRQAANGTLSLDLGARSHDVLAVSGSVSLGGTLAAHDLGTYHPTLGTTYRVLTAGSLGYGVTCVRTSGAASSSGHWAARHTSAAVLLTWRAGAGRTC